MINKYRIKKNEIGLRFRHGELREILQPGAYRVWPWSKVQIVDRLACQFTHRQLDSLLTDATLQRLLQVVDLKDDERALVFCDGRLGYILGPGRHAFWKEPKELKVETYNVDEFRFQHDKLESVLTHEDARRDLQAIRADASERVLVYLNGKLVETFGPGTFAYWRGAGSVAYKSVNLLEQVIDVAGQEIMTADRVTLRVNLMVTYKVTDALQCVSVVEDSQQAIYREAQLALRTAVGARTLDKLLTDKAAVANEVRHVAGQRAQQFGVELHSVGIRDVILPGEMKVIMNQVIEAQKRAEANLIRRREETAAARSQANTAKLLAENPVLHRMKELELLQEILAGTKATIVLGQGDLVEQVGKMVRSGEQ